LFNKVKPKPIKFVPKSPKQFELLQRDDYLSKMTQRLKEVGRFRKIVIKKPMSK
jgi:hypothetical protein